MKRPLYYLLCAIACTSMVSATMPMAAIADAIQPQATVAQQAQADTATSDSDKTEDTTSSNATGSGDPASDTEDNSGTPAGATSATDTATPAAPTPQPSLRAQANGTPEAISATSQTGYVHSATATQNGVTFTVSWNDAPAGTATTFHVTQTNGSSQAKARMDVPTYWDGGSQESVCDPSRPAWASYYSLGIAGHDFTFDFTASGTYRIHFYFMDNDRNDPQNDKGIYYLRTTAEVTVNDPARSSVTQIVNNAVAQCRQETNGSEYDMALWLHDWTLDQLEYDHSLNWCSAESGLTRHQGTCESYQRIYSKLLDAAGIANGRITGNGHTWNAVKIDGKWCQMDLTWDDTSENWYGDLDQRHLYFGLNDELMAIAHSDHTTNYQKDGYAYRSTDLSNNYFVRNGKADEWAEKYADRIQQHLDAKEESFSIDADNQSFPPSISGIQNGIVAYAMNLREWNTGGAKVELTAASNVTKESNSKWSAKYDLKAEYIKTALERVIPDGAYRVTAAVAPNMGVSAGESGCSLSSSAGALSFERDSATGLYRISSDGKLLTEHGRGNGAAAVLDDPNGSEEQLWLLSECTWGYTVTSASGLALDDRYCETHEGNIVWLYEPNGSAAQSWKLSSEAIPRVIPDGAYRVTAAVAPNMGVSAGESGCSLSSSAGALSFERDSATGLYRISSDGKLLTEHGRGNGAAAVLDDPNGSEEQLWLLSECTWGYTVTSASGLALDDRYCETHEGNIVWLYEPNGSAAQSWKLSS